MKTIRIKTGNQDMESLPTTSHSNTPKISKNCSGIPCQPFLSANVKVVCAAFRDFDQTPRIFFGGDPGWKPAGLQQHISSRDSHQGFLSNPVAYYLPPKRVIINVFTNEKMWKWWRCMSNAWKDLQTSQQLLFQELCGASWPLCRGTGRTLSYSIRPQPGTEIWACVKIIKNLPTKLEILWLMFLSDNLSGILCSIVSNNLSALLSAIYSGILTKKYN